MGDNGIPKIIPFTNKWHSEPYPFISPARPELSAAGKNIVVTGGGTGIGRAVSIAFARAGAKSITIIGRRADKLKEAVAVIAKAAAATASAASHDGIQTQVFSETADLGDETQVARAFRSVADRAGKVDVVVSNAGGAPVPGPLAQVNPRELSGALAQAVTTALNVVQAFLPVAGPEPVLLNTSTSMAHWLPTPGMGVYTVAKAAALKLFDVVGRESPGLRVVNVQPGWVATDMNGHQKEAPDSPDLPGQFYVWLASPEAKFLKGKLVWANWDAEELLSRAEEIENSRLLTTVLDGAPM